MFRALLFCANCSQQETIFLCCLLFKSLWIESRTNVLSVFHNTIAFTGIERRMDYVRGLILASRKVEVMCQTSRNNVERICRIFDHTILPEMKITTYYSHTPILSTSSILVQESLYTLQMSVVVCLMLC